MPVLDMHNRSRNSNPFVQISDTYLVREMFVLDMDGKGSKTALAVRI